MKTTPKSSSQKTNKRNERIVFSFPKNYFKHFISYENTLESKFNKISIPSFFSAEFKERFLRIFVKFNQALRKLTKN